MTEIRPFRTAVPDAELDDLHERLRRTRFLDDSPRRMPSGMTSAWLRELVDSWLRLDWRAREAELDRHPQFIADVGGTDVHFAHLRSATPGAPALLVMHGWPHTFALQLDFADLLPDFDVVVPSFPGFAWSPPADRPLDEGFLADLMHRLMTEVLGYDRYLTYGEDVSAYVNDLLASRYPEQVRGIIATHAHFPSREERAVETDAEAAAFFARLDADGGPHGAYGHVQATRPDTLAAALGDSPAGLLAWLAEKLAEWSDTGPEPADVERRISRERILTEAATYWFSRSIGTSFRPYYEGADQPGAFAPTDVPAAVFIQRHEADYPEVLARRFYRDLRVFERLDEGGHFTAAEVPQAIADRVRAFAATLD